MIFYSNARIFDGNSLLSNHSLCVENGESKYIIAGADIPCDSNVTSLDGGIITPGYVELQANGGGGVLFNEQPNAEGLATILTAHRQFGTVAMLPTFITDTKEQLDKALQAVRDGIAAGMHGLIGGHFEGPFLNLEKKGTHQPTFIRTPDASDYQRFRAEGLGKSLVTLAPECVPKKFINHLHAEGFTINAGHTMATKQDMETAYTAGLRGVTHLYNAMPPLQGREPSVIGSARGLNLTCGIIVDGVHSDAFSLQCAYHMFGASHLALVTDSMHTIGVSHITEFTLTGQRVFVQGNKLVNEHGALAGAHITMEECVQNAVTLMGATPEEALTMAITTPAHYIGRDDLSSLTNRTLKDILYLDDSLSIQPSPFTTNPMS